MIDPRAAADPRRRQLDRSLLLAGAVAVCLTLALLALVGRVAQLQHAPPEPLDEAAGSRRSQAPLIARRGALLDRRGRTLAVSEVGLRLFVDPKLIDDHRRFAIELARRIGDDPARIDRRIGRRADSRYVVIDPLLKARLVARIQDYDHPAVGLNKRLVRHYPQHTLAGQVVGFVGAEHIGLEGLEYELESTLCGRPGRVRYLRDVRRRPVWVEPGDYQPPEHGRDVRLSIDAVVQALAERHLADACEKYHAPRGEAVVLDPANGQVLAMANYPAFDPRQGGRTDPNVRRNRCVTDAYEPGSVFKPFVYAAATGAGVVDPDERIDCTEAGFFVTSAGRRLHDAHGHGTLDWAGVLVNSSNIGMAKVGLRLGAEHMYDAVRRFGFGSPTGSGLPGESPGIVNPLSRWNHYSITSVPMGQEIAVTPIQMAAAFSAFANGGLVPTPAVRAADSAEPIFTPAIDADVADATRRTLRRVVTEGTGRRAQSDKYRIWGKTGTAQVPDRTHGGYIDYTANFICGAPLNRPRVIVLVTVHRPDKSIGHYGGVVAAPAARQIVEQTLEYLAVPHDADAPDDRRDTRVADAS
ncbi:MAG: hypothetical protein GVY28_11905 [Alphaproteobacteria bacterium]|nr:hypothetical protein [Alphaproteobacteria bacterium]